MRRTHIASGYDTTDQVPAVGGSTPTRTIKKKTSDSADTRATDPEAAVLKAPSENGCSCPEQQKKKQRTTAKPGLDLEFMLGTQVGGPGLSCAFDPDYRTAGQRRAGVRTLSPYRSARAPARNSPLAKGPYNALAAIALTKAIASVISSFT